MDERKLSAQLEFTESGHLKAFFLNAANEKDQAILERALEFKLILLQMKNNLKAQMAKNFNPTLTRKLDCIIYLLENTNEFRT